MSPPAISVVGRHNSGKTTFLLRLLPLLARRGMRVGYLKHAHAGFEIDQPDKDSYGARRAGVVQTIVAGGGQVAVIDDAETPTLQSVLARYVRQDLDLLVVEGYKREALPKIEVARATLARSYVCADDPNLRAVVSDFDPPRPEVRRFGFDDAEAVADFVAAFTVRA